MVKELSLIERLELALEYSISEKHKKSLKNRIDEIEGKKETTPPAPEDGQVSLFY